MRSTFPTTPTGVILVLVVAGIEPVYCTELDLRGCFQSLRGGMLGQSFWLIISEKAISYSEMSRLIS